MIQKKSQNKNTKPSLSKEEKTKLMDNHPAFNKDKWGKASVESLRKQKETE